MSVEHTLARFAANAMPSDHAMSIMRLALFDWAVCAIAGQDEPVARILRNHAAMECPIGPACIVGGGQTAPSRAALINGATSHALDYDDTHFAHIGHTSVAVIPAVLGVAASRDMPTVLRAAMIGSEGAVRVGIWLGRDHYQVGFHQTATAGAFGATLAVGRVLGLDEDQIVTSLGLAATKAAGLKSQFGTMGKPLNAGLAAETGVLAAQWASAGLTSTERGLSGALGFAATHHALCDKAAFDTLGTQWLMQDVSHKFHACCHGLHAMLEALQDVSAPVDAMTVYTHPRWLSVCNNAAPRTGLEMKFSYKMTAAMRMAGLDTARIDSFSDAHAMDPTLKDLADRVTVVGDPDLSEMQCRIEVTGGSGCEVLFHDLQTPMTLAAREARLQSKGRAVVGAALADDLWAAVQADDVAPLMDLITRPVPV